MAGFRVGITSDFAPGEQIGRSVGRTIEQSLSDVSGLDWQFLPDCGEDVSPEVVSDYDAVIVGTPRWSRHSFPDGDRLILIASWGIGVDRIDVRTATERDVLVANSPTRANIVAVAESALTLVLALSKQLLPKHLLTVAGAGTAAQQLMGSLLRDRTIGTIGLGATARAFMKRLEAFEPRRRIAYDPYVPNETAAGIGVDLVELDMLMRTGDYVVVMCTLTEETRHLVTRDLLRSMKPDAYLVNVSRGPIVDQDALTVALGEGWIAGAGLDVFDEEPPPRELPLLALPNLIATGHAIAWTTETMVAACREPCRAVLRLYDGDLPEHVVNRDALGRQTFQAKLARRRRSWR